MRMVCRGVCCLSSEFDPEPAMDVVEQLLGGNLPPHHSSLLGRCECDALRVVISCRESPASPTASVTLQASQTSVPAFFKRPVTCKERLKGHGCTIPLQQLPAARELLLCGAAAAGTAHAQGALRKIT